MKTKWIIIAVVLALAIGIVWYLRTRKAKVKTTETGKNCLTVPKTFRKWTGNFSEMDTWYDQARAELLSQDPSDATLAARTAGFFKAVGVEPRGDYIRYYKDQIKTWLSSIEARPHWEVEEGELACLN